MVIEHGTDRSFSTYGRILDLPDELWSAVEQADIPCPPEGVAYEPTYEPLENSQLVQWLKTHVFGTLPVQVGYVSGHNRCLNGVEWHQGSEVHLTLDPFILLLAKRSDLEWNDAGIPSLNTEKVEAFYFPARTALELTGESLHLAPVSCTPEGYRSACVLLRGTNLPFDAPPENEPLQIARNKWMIVHPDVADGVTIESMIGSNVCLTQEVINTYIQEGARGV